MLIKFRKSHCDNVCKTCVICEAQSDTVSVIRVALVTITLIETRGYTPESGKAQVSVV